jgi:cytoskeleton protein RodZ
MPEIGETLREARMRGRIDVSEIEAETKIRAKYLRALENEEWDLLPGPTFVKTFLRTYADALGLDGKALVEEYRKSAEPPSDPIEPIAGPSRRVRGSSEGGPSRGYLALVAAVSVVIVLLIVGLVSRGGNGSTSTGTTGAGAGKPTGRHGHRTLAASPPASRIVTVSMQATGTVYVCLLGEGGRVLVPGRTLTAGEKTPTFSAKHFELTLGNNAVTLLIDGTPRLIRASPQAIGYSITKAGRRTLEAGHLPTCA